MRGGGKSPKQIWRGERGVSWFNIETRGPRGSGGGTSIGVEATPDAEVGAHDALVALQRAILRCDGKAFFGALAAFCDGFPSGGA